MPTPLKDRKYLDKITIALGLVVISSLLFVGFWLYTGNLTYISKYFYIHFAFLPIHALVIGLILDELIIHREKKNRRRRLNMFLGIFFRQMGMDIMLQMLLLVKEPGELEDMMLVDKAWKAKHFRRARLRVAGLQLKMNPDREQLARLFVMLAKREQDIITMTRNPLMLEFESLYRCLLSLFHLIEETHFRGQVAKMSDGVLEHLSQDAGKTLLLLCGMWLSYLEYLKGEHPVLFSFQVGLHNTIQPILLEDVDVK